MAIAKQSKAPGIRRGILNHSRSHEWVSIPFGDDSIEVKVEAVFHPAIRGAREGHLQLEPDEPAHYTIERAWVEERGELVAIPDWMFPMIAEEGGCAYVTVMEQIRG